MNPSPTEAPSPSLDPTLLAVIIRTTLDTIPHHPDAPAEEQDANREATYTIIASLRPRDPLEAMLAARIAAAHFQMMDDLRCAAQPDLPPTLKIRFRANAAALSRMQRDAQRELIRRQAHPALQPVALPAAIPAPRPRPAPATPRRAPGSVVAPTQADIARLLAEVDANLDAQAGVTGHRQAAAAASHPADDDAAPPTDAGFAQVVANAHAPLADLPPAPEDMGARLQAEVDARKAAATKLAA